MPRLSSIPVTMLTGFLGAGKTTLLNRFLKAPEAADAVVVVNEFGEVGIDHLLVERVGDGVVLLASGCLCCAIRGEWVETLLNLAGRRDAGTIPFFRRLIVETSGLADPAPILQAIMAHPSLQALYHVGGVITLIDAANGQATFDAHPQSVKQAAVADCLILSKSDLVADPTQIAELIARLRAINPSASILKTGSEDMESAALAAGLFDPASRTPAVKDWLAFPAHGHGGHGLSRHGSRIRSFSLTAETPITALALDAFLDRLRTQSGPDLLRMKALVALADDPSRPLVLHAVQHVLHAPIRLDHWPDGDQRSRLVFIMQDTDPMVIEALFAAFRDEPRTDTPDRAALTDNPLALR